MELYREYGHIDQEGNLKLYNVDQLRARAKQLPGTSIEIVILKRTGDMSHQQRKYYFSVIVPEMVKAFKFHGSHMTNEDVDDFLRAKFLDHLHYDDDDDTWKKERRRMSLAETDITTREFNEFVQFVITWAVQNMDWALPYPNEIFNFQDFTKSQIESLQKRNV